MVAFSSKIFEEFIFGKHKITTLKNNTKNDEAFFKIRIKFAYEIS